MARRGPKNADGKLLTYPSFHTILGIVWHMVHISDILAAPPIQGFFCEASWNGVFELSPTESWQEILSNSERRRMRPVGT